MNTKKFKENLDSNQWGTSITPLGNGKYGARVFHKGKLHSQDNNGNSKKDAAKNLKELLRWVDKLGYDSPMADKSRSRQK
jgi:hypothetical protein